MDPLASVILALASKPSPPEGLLVLLALSWTDPTFLACLAAALLLVGVFFLAKVQMSPGSARHPERPKAPPPVEDLTPADVTGELRAIRPMVGTYEEMSDTEDLPGVVPASDPPPITEPVAIPTAEEAALAEATDNWQRAAEIWALRGNVTRLLRALQGLGDKSRIWPIHLALERFDLALPLLQDLLAQSPGEEPLRLKAVETFIDCGKFDAAREMVDAVTQAGAPIAGSAWFLDKAGRAFEAVGQRSAAADCYRRAMMCKGLPPEVPQRLAYLVQFERLAEDNPESESSVQAQPSQFLQKAIEESQAPFLKSPPGTPNPLAAPVPGLPAGREVVLGHLVHGLALKEPARSVRSAGTASGRYTISRMLKEQSASAVFEGIDRLMDCTVVIRLMRLPDSEPDFRILGARIRAIAKLEHPFLGRTLFADRTDRVLRVVYEYLPGGNLQQAMEKLGAVGIALAARLALQISSVLSAAHAAGIVHGDLRVENVMLDSDQRVKLTDFALKPFPVRTRDPEETPSPDATSTLLPDEALSDITQFAVVLEYLLKSVVGTGEDTGEKQAAPMAELQTILRGIRSGGFTQMSAIRRALQELMDRSIPTDGNERRTRG